MFAEDKVATRRRRGMVRACRKDKITLRKVKHAMNARVAISRRRDMVKGRTKKSYRIESNTQYVHIFSPPNHIEIDSPFHQIYKLPESPCGGFVRDFLSSFKKY